jgi:DNA repair protein RadD
MHIRDEFRLSGVEAEHIDGKTPAEERDAILKKLSDGAIRLVVNCMVLTEGWDQPDVACIVLARPTKSMGLFRQMIGRVLRPAEGKADALVLDHSGASFLHGFVEDPVGWTLDTHKRATNKAQAAANGSTPRELTTCPECSAVRVQGKPCSACGWRPQPKKEAIETVNGDLAHLHRDGTMTGTVADLQSFHGQLAQIARDCGYKHGWAAHQFYKKHGFWPPTRHPKLVPPTAATLAWVRSRQIAYAKSQAKRRGG